MIGREQIYNPDYSIFEKAYIALFGMPIVGLRIRARNVIGLIPPGHRFNRILDAGSGPGVFAFELARRYPAARVTGIDLLPEPIRTCRHIAARTQVANITFLQSSITALDARETFDLVLCVDILEHIEDDGNALQHLYRAMAPSSILVLHVPALYRRYPVLKKCLNFDVETHVRTGYRVDEITDKVQGVGFKISSKGYTYGFWETLANNLSYMITHARMENRILYALVFPMLNLISLLGRGARPQTLGAGIFVVARK